jgi:hypothetical protein
MNEIWQWFKKKFKLMDVSEYYALAQAAVEEQKKIDNAKFDRCIEQEHARCDELIQHIQRIEWKRINPTIYQMNLTFDSQLFCWGYGNSREQMEFAAKMMARQVEREIATCKFVQKAKESRYRYPEVGDTNAFGKL